MSNKKIYVAAGAIAFVGAGVTVPAMDSCETDCTLEARPSIIVNIAHPDGSHYEPLTAESVWYEFTPEATQADGVDGLAPPAAPHRAICIDEACSQWSVGLEEEGDFRIFANICGETVEGRAKVGRTADGCHVDTQTITLEPSQPERCNQRPVDQPKETACTTEARVSVLATTIDEGATHVVPADEVTYLVNDQTAPQKAHCANNECSLWAVGYEVAGNFTITASACGDTGSTTVTVGMTEDGCHVATESVMIEVDGDRCQDKIDLPKQCDGILVPSIFVYVAEDGGDVFLPFQADRVSYGYQGKDQPAKCIDDPKCSNWIAGFGIGGNIDLEVEACGKVYERRVEVKMSDDGCHPITEHVTMLVETDGCQLALPGSETPPPPPPSPATPGSIGR